MKTPRLLRIRQSLASRITLWVVLYVVVTMGVSAFVGNFFVLKIIRAIEENGILYAIGMRMMSIMLTLLLILTLVVLTYLLRRSIHHLIAPLTAFTQAVDEVAKGNLQVTLPDIHSKDEMRRLHDSFQTMQSSLLEYIEELKTTTAANERIQSDIELARKIQRGMLLKKFPPFLYATLHPAKSVGGDLYDFTLKGDQLYFAIGDVSGKGVAASIVMAITRVLLRFVVGMGLPLDETLLRINNSFSEANETGMFVTLFVARLDLKTGHMDYCNAGHNQILIIPPDSEPYFLHSKANVAVGVMSGFQYDAEQIDLKLGTRIVAYTDGVTEAEKADQSQYGEERLMAWAKSVVETFPETTAQEKDVVENLYDSVQAFVEGNPQNDDLTIVSLKL